ncbi:hypothetical protein FAZ69_08530 [Trinickia terrae]|uniref:Uncharacterized protein n=1 Tax=Trinickia terrae TaxID=2571161 RepID=A0A4U1I9M8_9BURK|nr:hypothetical protein [Trinickia terrae]TKC90183.1 hypothetical protein FAZ69_08530 [Trinickia terrae]
MNGKPVSVRTESGVRRSAERVCAPVLLLLSLLMLLYPFLHASATIRSWNTPALPQDWPLNLGIALFVGIAGMLLLGASWRMAQRAYGFSRSPNSLAKSRNPR